MKEIALVGSLNSLYGDVLSQLLKHEISVNALVPSPEKLMIDNSLLTVTALDPEVHNDMVKALTGYKTAVFVYNDNLTDAESNRVTLKTYNDNIRAAREAGVERVLVVGSENSQAFFTTDLRRLDDIDWVFISNVGPYAKRVRKEVEKPRCHREVYVKK